MYISNSSNIGMATLLQNNKNCMKTLTNGTSVVGVGTTGTNHIIVGNVVNTQSVGQQQPLQSNHHQVSIVNSTNVPTQTIATSTQSGTSAINTLGGNFVLPTPPQTILLTNGTTGASTILTYQQYQQLLQQQQQQQQQRLLVSQNLVNLPIGNLITTGNGGLAVITDNSSNHNVATSGSTSTTQGAFLVASSSAVSTTGTSSFQQQFQQQLSNFQNVTNTTSNTTTNTTPTTQATYLQQHSSNQQQRLLTTASVVAVASTSSATGGSNTNSNTASIRNFSQVSQQQKQPANINIPNSNTNNVNNQQQQHQRTTTVLINRNNNTIIAGNTTQRLQHATILKNPANIIKTTQQQHQPTLVVNNMAVQQVINSSNGQIISLVKTTHTQQQISKNLATKTKQQSTTANLPQQQKPQLQRYSNNTIQQIKQQQLKVVTANTTNLQAVPQRATIINSNSITKNHVVLSNSINNKSISNNTTKIVNLTKTSTTNTSIANTNTNTNISNSQYNTQQQQINGHLKSIQQQQPASKIVPNGHNNNTINISSNKNGNNSSNTFNTNRSSTNTSTTTSSASATANSSSSIITNTTSYIHTTPASSQTITTSALPKNTNSTLTHAISSSNPLSNTSSSPTTTPTTDKNSTAANIFNSNLTATTTNTTNTTTTTVSVLTDSAGIVAGEQQESEPEVDIVINNVVCSFSVRCHLNLREIALNGANVEYRRENGMVTMKLRRPYTTASIWSSGRITCTGATSEEQAKIAARRYARCLEKLGFHVRFHNFRVVNVLGTCSMPWAIKIVNFSEKYREAASYEPELHPGVTYKLRFPKATLKIFSTGSITVTAASVANVQAAIEHIFPLVYEFRKKRSPEELEQLRLKQQQNATFEDIVEIDNVVSDSRKEIGILNQNNLQRRPISNTFSKMPNAKRKRFGDDVPGDMEDVDDPDCTVVDADEDDIVMYDPNESIIEGPDDEDL